MGRVEVVRVYDRPSRRAGTRVLVDRLRPRGVPKERGPWDVWCHEVAPSTELRRWYGHDPARFEEFRRRYRDELRRGEAAAALRDLRERARRGDIVLVTATKDVGRSAVTVLAERLRRSLARAS